MRCPIDGKRCYKHYSSDGLPARCRHGSIGFFCPYEKRSPDKSLKEIWKGGSEDMEREK